MKKDVFINATTLLKRLNADLKNDCEYYDSEREKEERDKLYHFAIDQVKVSESADVEPIVLADWHDEIICRIDGTKSNSIYFATCSNCKTRSIVERDRNEYGGWYINSQRCPHCGAHMTNK